jgi:PadR family transcriptional regulator, regulatory protein PadR
MARGQTVMKGSLDLLVLKSLTWGPLHGLEILSWIERASDDGLDLEDSALYQALHRLEAKRLVHAEWGVSENNRRARYYRLTELGRENLRVETKRWLTYAETITRVVTALRAT